MLPANYPASRATFLELAQGLHAMTESVPCGPAPSVAQPSSPDPPDSCADCALSIDTAYLGAADAPVLVVIASGTHGIEGYAGAACQFEFMRRYARNVYSATDNNIAFLLVHAVNPWGFFHGRRVTHEGVDLNRNFIEDFSAPPPSCGYSALHRRLVQEYQPLPAGLWNEMRLWQSALGKQSRAAMRAAITGGQYRHPDGLFYGGAAPTQSRLAWEGILNRHAGNRRCAALLDIHTGLGRRGTGELISYLPDTSTDFLEMSSWFGGQLRSMQSGQSVSAPVEGTLTAGFDRLLACQSYAIGLEFGTRSALSVLNAMRLDQWVHRHAARLPHAYRHRARQTMQQAFSVATPAWHAQVTARFDQVMRQLLSGLRRSSR